MLMLGLIARMILVNEQYLVQLETRLEMMLLKPEMGKGPYLIESLPGLALSM